MITTERIILVGGPGGVGKTTLAASIGVALAKQGFRTVVLTVDPARRLAQALGLPGFTTELQQVPLTDTTGTLFASMLDAQRYFDRIIVRFARNEEQKNKILANPIYRTMVDSLGGTHEYAAMERLFEFSNDTHFDRVVVDTPPTQNALDLLAAPQRLADFMDNSVLRWFQGPKPYYLKIFQTGTKVAMKLLQRIFGSDFLAEFGRLMDDIDGMQAGFKRRNLEVLNLLQSPASAFLLVTYPNDQRFRESQAFAATLKEQQIRLKGILLNRTEPLCVATSEEIQAIPDANRSEVVRWIDYQSALFTEQQRWIAEFRSKLSDIPLCCIPDEAGLVGNLEALAQLGKSLVSSAKTE